MTLGLSIITIKLYKNKQAALCLFSVAYREGIYLLLCVFNLISDMKKV